MTTVESLCEAVQKGKTKDVLALIEAGLDEGVAPEELLNEGLLKGMGLLGVRFKNNEVFVPEVLLAARALNKGTELLKPKLIEAGVEAKGKAVIGTVLGDLHDIGKNLVKMMLEGSGFEVVDLGVDVSDQRFVEAVVAEAPDVLCLSALLTTTMGQQKTVVAAVEAAGLRDKVKILVGGAPVTPNFCAEIGADGYAPDAASAAELATAMLER
ncbi:MAG: corrinoid protein [Propionibacteriaceae bacterium]|jgi:5-methyltetrahydrofolate--homocysteine methyltransferase|nr:corrinoid protein [Propionibacteriaceae bacterium]